MDIAELGIWIGVIGGSVSALLGLIKLSQELWRAFRNIGHMVDDLRETKNLVQHHLGPNGNTKPIHERITAIEDTMETLDNRMSQLEGRVLF